MLHSEHLDRPALPVSLMLDRIPAFLSWLAEEHAATTVRDYRGKLARFVKWLEIEGREFSRRSVVLYLNQQQEEGLRPRTIRCTYTAIRAFERYLRTEEVDAPNLASIRLPRMDAPQRVSPTNQQVQELFSGAARMPGHTPVGRYRKRLTLGVLAVLAYAGLRAAELLALNVTDQTTDRSGALVLRVRKGKGGECRWIPVNSVLAGYLAEWLETRATWLGSRPDPGGAMWLNDKRTRLAIRGLEALWDTLLEHAGLLGSGIQRHSLRHWFGSGAAREDLKTASVLLGHASISSTALYLHTEPEKMKAATDGLIGLSNRKPPESEAAKRMGHQGHRYRRRYSIAQREQKRSG